MYCVVYSSNTQLGLRKSQLGDLYTDKLVDLVSFFDGFCIQMILNAWKYAIFIKCLYYFSLRTGCDY